MTGLLRTLVIVLVIIGVGFGGYKLFHKQIDGIISGVKSGTGKHDRYDPTKDSNVSDDASNNTSNGHQAFHRKDPAANIDDSSQ
jgi:Na+/H+ antiporter NhaB